LYGKEPHGHICHVCLAKSLGDSAIPKKENTKSNSLKCFQKKKLLSPLSIPLAFVIGLALEPSHMYWVP
jgi:hypothetical protein